MNDHFDFFISYAGADRAWAEWTAWQLAEAGYTVELDVWNWAAGQNFVTAISDALERCDRVVALFSAAYFDRSRYTTEEWTAATLHVPGTAAGKLVPVRIEAVAADIPAILRPLVYRDLFGMTEEQARRGLLEAETGPFPPKVSPGFPGQPGNGPRLPGTIPRIWNIQARNPGFTGRDELLVAMRERLLTKDKAGVQALHGMGGVGKTQLAIEYAYRFAGTYDFAWWVNAEHGGLIGAQFAALGLALGCVDAEADIEVVRAAVLAELRDRGRWLLVFDNAENPADIARWLPGSGHVLITSRERTWFEVATPVEVGVLARTESVALLRGLVPALSRDGADAVADAVGDLPLAVTQAAGYMASTGMPAREYVDLLASQALKVLGQGRPALYDRTLAVVIQVAFARLREKAPAAAQLAEMCATLGPELIATEWFTSAVEQLPVALAEKASDPVAWRDVLAQLSHNSLTRIDQNGIEMHRLTQAVIRGDLSSELAAVIRSHVEAVLAANHPGSSDAPESWPHWARLTPHLLSLDPAASSNLGLRELACDAASYLVGRGDVRTGYELAGRLYQQWHDRLGPDDEHTLWAAGLQAWGARELGRYEEARDLDRDVLTRRRRVLGDDDPSTLNSATNLATDLSGLGDTEAARELHEDTLARKRRVLGEDDPSTLTSANNLAITLRALDRIQAARDLNQDTLTRRRAVLGADHPRTLDSAYNLAFCWYDLGDYRAARDLDKDTLERRQVVLGTEHPSTLSSANRLAVDLHELGELDAARDLYQDTLNRRRRVLGEDHPDTLRVANNLGYNLRELGEPQAARDLHQDALDRYRRILGDDDPMSLASANNLAVDLLALGEIQVARDLHQDTLDRYRRVLGQIGRASCRER